MSDLLSLFIYKITIKPSFPLLTSPIIVLNSYLIQKFAASALALKKCLYAEKPVSLCFF